MLGRYKTQGNYRYKAFDEYRYGHGALLALGHIRAGECIVMGTFIDVVCCWYECT